MLDSGVQLKKGDYVTIFAKGAINTWPAYGGNFYLSGPRKLLMYRFGEKNFAESYKGPELIEVRENARVFLGYRGSRLDMFGEPRMSDYNSFRFSHRQYVDDIGAFDVDIIVWKANDPNLIVKFFEEPSLARPKDETLKEIAQEFRRRQEVLVGLQEKTKEIEGIKKELSNIADREMEAKPVITPPMEKETPEAKKPEREKEIPDQKMAKIEGKTSAAVPKDKEMDGVNLVPEKQTPPVIPKPTGERRLLLP